MHKLGSFAPKSMLGLPYGFCSIPYVTIKKTFDKLKENKDI